MRVFTSATAFLSLQKSHHQRRSKSKGFSPQTERRSPHSSQGREGNKFSGLNILSTTMSNDRKHGESMLHYQRHEREEDLTLVSQDLTILYNVISDVSDVDFDVFGHECPKTSLSSAFDGAVSSLGELIATAQEQMLLKDNGSGSYIISENQFESITSKCPKLKLAKASLLAAQSLRNLLVHYGPGRGMGRKALMTTVSGLNDLTLTNTLATISLVSALSIYSDDHLPSEDHRHASRAAVSGLLPSGRYQNKPSNDDESKPSAVQNNFGSRAVCALLDKGEFSNQFAPGCTVDLHIVTGLARAFVSDSSPLAKVCANVIRETLLLHENDDVDKGTITNTNEIDKKMAASTFGLAAEIGPWTTISCVSLVNLSIDVNLWHAAERLCASAIQNGSKDAHNAVHVLIDRSFEQHMYRQADALSTRFYDHGGRSKFAKARFLHACSTISKVVLKRQFPLIERQVERVDKAIDRVQGDTTLNDFNGERLDANKDDARVQVREFALTRLREVNEHDTAHRLAVLWKMVYWYNLEDTEKYKRARREKYLQWDEAFSSGKSILPVPEIVSNHEELRKAFNKLISSSSKDVPVIGFDVEWGDECQGAALLQLSTLKFAILIDIPALAQNLEGCKSLNDTVGNIFGSTSIKLLGFSCRQDLSRLRNSPSVQENHWFVRTDAVVDIKPLIALDKPILKERGLSRVSEYYLGKLLDKAEQCSQWEKRPLSESQRVYAALDAWTVVAVYGRFSTFTKSLS